MSENTPLLLYKATILQILDYNDLMHGLLTKQQQTKLTNREHKIEHGGWSSVGEMHSSANNAFLNQWRDKYLLIVKSQEN